MGTGPYPGSGEGLVTQAGSRARYQLQVGEEAVWSSGAQMGGHGQGAMQRCARGHG